MFILIVDDFSIEYVVTTTFTTYELSSPTNIQSRRTSTEKNDGIDLKWNYKKIHAQRTCCLSMDGYIANLLLKYGNKYPTKTQLSPHHHREINYGSKEQLMA